MKPHNENNLAVWTLDASSLLAENAFTKNSEGISYSIEFVIAPAASNANLLAQQCLLTMIRPRMSDWDSEADISTLDNLIAHRYDSLGYFTEQAILIRLRLPLSKAQLLFTLLAKCGYTRAQLFLGYKVVIDALKEKELWLSTEAFRDHGYISAPSDLLEGGSSLMFPYAK